MLQDASFIAFAISVRGQLHSEKREMHALALAAGSLIAGSLQAGRDELFNRMRVVPSSSSFIITREL